MDIFDVTEYITFPFTQHGFVHRERKKVKSKMRELYLIATKKLLQDPREILTTRCLREKKDYVPARRERGVPTKQSGSMASQLCLESKSLNIFR